MSRYTPSLSLFISLFLTTGCGAAPVPESSTASTGRSASADRRGQQTHAGGEALANAGDGSCELVPVYFQYDEANIDPGARDQLRSNASCLRAQPARQVTLVGGADARGTEEYNLALGSRRANATRTYLEQLGVETARMGVHSVGEEWAVGGEESAMQTDRRVEPRARVAR